MKTWVVKHVRSMNFLEAELNGLEKDGWTVYQVVVDTDVKSSNFRINIVAYKLAKAA